MARYLKRLCLPIQDGPMMIYYLLTFSLVPNISYGSLSPIFYVRRAMIDCRILVTYILVPTFRERYTAVGDSCSRVQEAHEQHENNE